MMTPLHYAAKYAKMEAATALINHGADPTIPGDDGCLPLHFVVKLGFKINAFKRFSFLHRIWSTLNKV